MNYDNCYAIVSEIRHNLNEYSLSLVQGAEQGAFANEAIIHKINAAQSFLFATLSQRIPDLFTAIIELTGVDSVYTLPANFSTIEWFKDNSGVPIVPIQHKYIVPTAYTGLKNTYYRVGNELRINRSGIVEVCTLYYRWKPRKITSGKSTDGALNSITLDINAVDRPNYYEGMILENITQDWSSEIDLYRTSVANKRVATMEDDTVTCDTGDYYGIVSDLPEEFHPLITAKATIMMKSTPLSQDKPSRSEINDFEMVFIETLRAFAGTAVDVNIDELFTNYNITSLEHL
ncbi:MAG: hypothetical protein JJV89_02010 [Desulfosarcina sp.]|nr:hypothetical protein [Desulfobacterales bacterium]